ncbi:uncharacterized protein [Leptinotarsa decemlineata]|uniref:uncharacterized protein n=1 Tax=Leptinotarsa decemlineata TaxID=7539 RepID=UPI003D308AFA
MLVHWKSLIGFGLVFWILLCVTDFLGGKSRSYHMIDDEDLILINNLKRHESSHEIKVLKFGWRLALWNFIAFAISLVFCSFAKIVFWFFWKIFIYSKAKYPVNSIEIPNSARSSSNHSKIPVMMKYSPKNLRSSDTNLKLKAKINADVSCPNLSAPSRSPSVISQCKSENLPKCRTLYKNNRIFSADENETETFESQADHQCKKLREEIAKLQSTSLKEHAALSRKLEAITKEKKEVSKLLAVAQKENRAAKKQIEELLQEKGVLIKKLENASKEFKSNIKTKKVALAKLEEVTANVESLKQQLEQATRDKEILENKLKVLGNEYEKLQERLILSNQQNFFNNENRPEREFGESEETIESKQGPAGGRENIQLSMKETQNDFESVSQTELDMKKIQVKIKQLERNLENFNNKTEVGFSNGEQDESEISLSIIENNSEFQMKTEDDTDFSDYHISNSPRLRLWRGRAGEVIQTLASKVNEKVRFLHNIRESGETELDEYSSQESLDDSRCPTRIVSSSVAFQKFLKGLQPCDNMRRQFESQCDLIF